jgi:hypothetical protein
VNDEPPLDRELPDEPPGQPPRPLQFTIRGLLGATAAVALVFGVLRWLSVPPRASAIILAILALGVIAAIGLVAAIGSGGDDAD